VAFVADSVTIPVFAALITRQNAETVSVDD